MPPSPGRAVTRRQKLELIRRLYEAWLSLPDLRLGQLLYNATGGLDIFNDEDFPLIEAIEKLVQDVRTAGALLHRRGPGA